MLSLIHRFKSVVSRIAHHRLTCPASNYAVNSFKILKNGTTIRSYSNFKNSIEYDQISNQTLDMLFEDVETLSDLPGVSKGHDIEFSNGVLTIKLGQKGTFVINRQPPNQQIWLSSPISGPKRYDYDNATQKWIYNRDGSNLHELLREELSQLTGHDIILR